MLINFPNCVFWLSPTITFITWFLARWRCTILTSLYIRAGKVIRIFSYISLTGFFWDTIFISICINLSRISSVTWSTGLTINNYLWRKSHVWPNSFSNNINSISKWTSRAVSPAGTTISRDMLISWPWKIINTAYISPIPRFWQSAEIEILMRSRRSN
jgi:hypothetical protein